jgi:uncharacterized protein (DUF1501 family)
MNNNLCNPWEHRLSRRQWLGGVCAAGLGLATPVVAEEMKKKEKQVLFVWLDGGLSQLESWDPKPNTQFGGPFRAIPTSVPGMHISELWPKTAKLMHHLALVRSMCTKDNSHSAGVARIQRGDPKNRGVTYPYIGSAIARILGPTESGLPPYVWVKPMSGGFIYQDAGFLGPKYGALALGDGKAPEGLIRPANLSAEDDAVRNELRNLLDRRYAEKRSKEWTEANSFVFDMAAKLQKHRAIFDSSTVPPKDVERYGTHEFGRHMLVARRLLEAGVRFVKVNSYYWDYHGDNFNGHRGAVPKVDQAFSAMIEDLAARGMLDNVLVVMMSEFGRTPRINGDAGRDHWPEAWSVIMGGGGLKHGVVVGKTNDAGTWVNGDEHDIGHLFHTWFAALGINSKKVKYNNAGQPLPIAHDDCSPIKELLA